MTSCPYSDEHLAVFDGVSNPMGDACYHCVDEETAEMLSRLNYIGEYIFAFDHIEDKKIIEEKLAIVKKYIPKDWKIKFFIYCSPKMKIQSDVLNRIEWCKENRVLPYFMRDLSCWNSPEVRTYNDFSAWCNQPGIFKHHTYKEFCIKRRPSKAYPDCCPDWFNNQKDIDGCTLCGI